MLTGDTAQVDERTGPAAETLDALLAAGEGDSYDFAFIGMGPYLAVSQLERSSPSMSCIL